MANNNEQQKQGQVQVNMTPEVEKGVYSNLAIMGFTPTEFIMDFVFHHPGMPRANVQSRVVMYSFENGTSLPPQTAHFR